MNDYIYERAMLCRERIQGSDPFQLLRDLGIVLMISNAFAKDHLRGFCTMANGVPYVVINGNQPEEEQRVAAAHEAGHLLLHQDRLRDGVPLYDLDICSNRGRLEQQANLFAADFLLGDDEVLEQMAGGDADYFAVAKALSVPAPLLSFKLFSMVRRGYPVRMPVELDSTFLK